jgi:hypothetical protein
MDRENQRSGKDRRSGFSLLKNKVNFHHPAMSLRPPNLKYVTKEEAHIDLLIIFLDKQSVLL